MVLSVLLILMRPCNQSASLFLWLSRRQSHRQKEAPRPQHMQHAWELGSVPVTTYSPSNRNFRWAGDASFPRPVNVPRSNCHRLSLPSCQRRQRHTSQYHKVCISISLKLIALCSRLSFPGSRLIDSSLKPIFAPKTTVSADPSPSNSRLRQPDFRCDTLVSASAQLLTGLVEASANDGINIREHRMGAIAAAGSLVRVAGKEPAQPWAKRPH